MKTTLSPFENAKRTANGTGGGVSPAVIEEMQAEISILGSQNKTQAQDITDIKGSLKSINDNLNEVVNNLGAKNMLPNNATSQVVAGITYTINSDGSITISGTSTASNGIVLSSNQLLHKGTYKTTTGQTQEEDADAVIYVQDTNTQRIISRSNDLELPSQFTLANDTLVNYGVWIDVGKTVNVTIYPMVRPASIVDDTYAPYAQTNKELTDNLTELKNYVKANDAGTRVSLNSSYSTSNPFICPSDGYLNVYKASSKIFGASTTSLIDDNILASIVGDNSANIANAIFVKKGMKIVVSNFTSLSVMYYCPIE